MMNLLPYFIAWTALAVVLLGVALMRRQIASREDDSLHLANSEAALVTGQVELAKKLDTLDRWGKLLTILLAASGIALGSVWALRMWEAASRTTFEK